MAYNNTPQIGKAALGAGDRGAPNRPIVSPPNLSLPPELEQLLNNSFAHPGAAMQQAPMSGADMPNYARGGMVGKDGLPRYAVGGMVGDMGAPVPEGMPQQGMPQQQLPLGAQPGGDIALSGQDAHSFAQTHPEAVQQIAAELQQMIQAGELTPQQLQMGAKLAETAMNDPSTYPQIRKYAIQQGIVSPEDMPEQYDEAVLFLIVLGADAIQGMQQGQPMGMDQMQNYAEGGLVTPGSDGSSGGPVVGPGTGTSDDVPIRVSTGEYVIPAHVVEMKGREFFDKMIENYNPENRKK